MPAGVRVRVRSVQGRGARPDGAVHAEVPGSAGAAEPPGLLHVERAPVPDRLGERRPLAAGGRLAQLTEDAEVLGRADVRRTELVHHADAVPGGVLQRAQDRRLAVGAGRHPEQPVTCHVVGVPGDQPGGVVAGGMYDVGAGVEEGGAEHGRVHVDAGEEHRAALGGPVELLAGERPLFRPERLVPPEAEEDGRGGVAGVRGHRVEGLGQRGGRAQVDAGGREARLGEVHVRVDERWRDQPAVQLDDPVGTFLEVHRGVVVAGPDDGPAVDAESGGVRVGRRVDVSTAEQDAGHASILTAGARTAPAPPRVPAAGTARSRRAQGRSRCR